MMRRRLIILLLAAQLGGCAWFGGKTEEAAKPAELKSINAEVRIEPAWEHKLGDEERDRASGMVPALAGGRIFAASADGNVVALEPGGRVIWERNVREFYSPEERDDAFTKKLDVITGGVGAGGDLLAVGTAAGEIVALNQSDGSLAWRARTTSEVLAPPVLDRDLVVAQSIDGKVAAYNALDGTRLWVYSTSVPSLTLRGTAQPLLGPDSVITGFANGRVVALDRDRGLAYFDQRLAVAQGRSDLERLVDVDGRLIVRGGLLYAAAYQGTLAAINLSDGRVPWSVETSTTAGLGTGFGNVYISHADGSVIAYDDGDGQKVWENDALTNRELTAPVTISSYIVVGDLEGYLHLIAQADGRFVGRRKVSKEALKAPAVVDGGRIYIQTVSGKLLAFELR